MSEFEHRMLFVVDGSRYVLVAKEGLLEARLVLVHSLAPYKAAPEPRGRGLTSICMLSLAGVGNGMTNKKDIGNCRYPTGRHLFVHAIIFMNKTFK